MKNLKAQILLFLVILTWSTAIVAQERTIHEARLLQMMDNGVIDQEDGQKHLRDLKGNRQDSFHHQVRGVASKINEAKTYEFVNPPLEISTK